MNIPGQLEDERELLKQAQAGEADAFGDLYERYAPAIFRYLYARLHDRLEAEDLTGEVFLKAWQFLPRYSQRGVPFQAFLFRIAHNALIDQYRSGHRSKSSESPELVERLPDPQPGPPDRFSASLERQEVFGKLEQLSQDYQSVLILRFISDLSPEETAHVMKRSSGAIRVLQHRALAALRKLLSENNVPVVQSSISPED
jgi:RNA polymerase sigma-70 factor (ECF subfamily)